ATADDAVAAPWQVSVRGTVRRWMGPRCLPIARACAEAGARTASGAKGRRERGDANRPGATSQPEWAGSVVGPWVVVRGCGLAAGVIEVAGGAGASSVAMGYPQYNRATRRWAGRGAVWTRPFIQRCKVRTLRVAFS